MINEPQNAFNIDLSVFAGLRAGKWLNAKFTLSTSSSFRPLLPARICIRTYIHLSGIYMHGDLSKCKVARYKFNLHVKIFVQFKMNTSTFLHPFEFVQTHTHKHPYIYTSNLFAFELVEAQSNCCYNSNH